MNIPIDRAFELLMAAIQGDNSMTDIVRRAQWLGFHHITDNGDCDSDHFFFRLRQGQRTITLFHYRYPHSPNKERHIWFLLLKGAYGLERYKEWVWSYRWEQKNKWVLIDETDTPRREYADLGSLLLWRTRRYYADDDFEPTKPPRKLLQQLDQPYIPGLLSSVNDNQIGTVLKDALITPLVAN